jgi:hypothetical protein
LQWNERAVLPDKSVCRVDLEAAQSEYQGASCSVIYDRITCLGREIPGFIKTPKEMNFEIQVAKISFPAKLL